MPTYIVTLKKETTTEQVAAVKAKVVKDGGKITHEYTIFKGFTVEFPEDAVSTLEAEPHVAAVEKDGEVHTQK